MSAYEPPVENLPIFNPSVFVDENEALTIATGSRYFLKYPFAQGTENLQDTNVNGVLTTNGNLIMTPSTEVVWTPTDANYIINDIYPRSLTTGTYNTGINAYCLAGIQGGSFNNAMGDFACYSLQNGSENTCIGSGSGYSLVNSSGNSFFGKGAGEKATGGENTFIGRNSSASFVNTTLTRSTALGAETNNANFSDSTAIGFGATNTSANQIRLGRATETVSCPNTLSFVMNDDNTAGTYFIPFSKVAAGTEGQLFIDSITSGLNYNPSTSTIGATNVSLSGTSTAVNYIATNGEFRANVGTTNCAYSGNITTAIVAIANGQTTGALEVCNNAKTSGAINIANGTSLNGCTMNIMTGNFTGVNGATFNLMTGNFTSTSGGTVNLLTGNPTNTSNVNIGNSANVRLNVNSQAIFSNTISTSITTSPSSARHLGYLVQQSTAGWTTAITANTQTNITSIAFTAVDYGTYLFNAMVQITPTDNTASRQQILGINTVSANYGTFIDLQYTMANVGHPMLKVSRTLNIYANTTVYLVGYVLGTAGTVVTAGSAGIFTWTRIA